MTLTGPTFPTSFPPQVSMGSALYANFNFTNTAVTAGTPYYNSYPSSLTGLSAPSLFRQLPPYQYTYTATPFLPASFNQTSSANSYVPTPTLGTAPPYNPNGVQYPTLIPSSTSNYSSALNAYPGLNTQGFNPPQNTAYPTTPPSSPTPHLYTSSGSAYPQTSANGPVFPTSIPPMGNFTGTNQSNGVQNAWQNNGQNGNLPYNMAFPVPGMENTQSGAFPTGQGQGQNGNAANLDGLTKISQADFNQDTLQDDIYVAGQAVTDANGTSQVNEGDFLISAPFSVDMSGPFGNIFRKNAIDFNKDGRADELVNVGGQTFYNIGQAPNVSSLESIFGPGQYLPIQPSDVDGDGKTESSYLRFNGDNPTESITRVRLSTDTSNHSERQKDIFDQIQALNGDSGTITILGQVTYEVVQAESADGILTAYLRLVPQAPNNDGLPDDSF